MPGHTSREVLIVFSSLTTCDPANIYDLIKVQKWSLTTALNIQAIRLKPDSCSVITNYFSFKTLNTFTVFCSAYEFEYAFFFHLKCLKAVKIRVSIIGLSAEVRVCTVLARETGGMYLKFSSYTTNTSLKLKLSN